MVPVHLGFFFHPPSQLPPYGGGLIYVMSLLLTCEIDLLIRGNHHMLRGSVIICHQRLLEFVDE